MKKWKAFIIALTLCLIISGCGFATHTPTQTSPAVTGDAYTIVNDNTPNFTQDEITAKAYERYAPLDKLDRCGVAMACLGKELMPTEDRESISHIKPSGWVQAQYDFVDGKNLYNRCHLIGFQLSGENDNERNLITGTRYMNVEGMLPFENMVADYIKETGNHVMYRVTPVYEGNNLVASGVYMEAMSVEDQGYGIQFHIFAYNSQPGVVIDYKTGESTPERIVAIAPEHEGVQTFVLNTNSKKFHRPDCKQAKSIKPENVEQIQSTQKELLNRQYAPAGCCFP